MFVSLNVILPLVLLRLPPSSTTETFSSVAAAGVAALSNVPAKEAAAGECGGFADSGPPRRLPLADGCDVESDAAESGLACKLQKAM
jgi:hypothetical protein